MFLKPLGAPSVMDAKATGLDHPQASTGPAALGQHRHQVSCQRYQGAGLDTAARAQHDDARRPRGTETDDLREVQVQCHETPSLGPADAPEFAVGRSAEPLVADGRRIQPGFVQ